jgi:hypothetical protein
MTTNDPDVFDAMKDATPTDREPPPFSIYDDPQDKPEKADAVVVEAQPARSDILLRRRQLDITTHSELYRIAERTFHSGVAVYGCNSPNDMFIALATGVEAGLSITKAMHSVYMINGKPTLYGDALLALVLSSGTCADLEERYDAEEGVAYCKAVRIHRLIDGTFMRRTCQRTFSIEQAKTAGLWGKKGPWTQYPERMLQHRARSLVLRDAFPDVIGGLYMREEVDDYVEFDPSRMRAVRGTSEGLLDEEASDE